MTVLKYGNVLMRATRCPKCRTESFIDDDGRTSCCSIEAYEREKGRIRLVCGPRLRRSRPSVQRQRECLDKQNGKCFYCANDFGMFVEAGGIAKRLTPCWDHFVPYSYSANNSDANFVAACQVCNGIKTNLVFEHEEDARAFVRQRWARKGIRIL